MVQTFSLFSYGFILPLDLILEKNIAINGNSVISVEQDVYFKDGTQELAIHESWLIDSDKNLKLVATGLGELKDSVRITALYNGQNRTTLVGKNKVTDVVGRDFFERYLSIRSLDAYKNYLNDLTVSPKVRLSRANGAIAFAIGETSATGSLKPQVWFKQDSFELSKVRFPSEAEVSFEDYSIVSPMLNYPKTKKLDWAGKNVIIKVRSIKDRIKAPSGTFQAQKLESASEIVVANKSSVGLMIEEFYKRFR